MAPVLSVLMPFRDAEATLPEALGGLGCADEGPWELVAVDDGSRDGSRSLVEAFEAPSCTVRVVAPGRVGLVAALSVGLADCRAPLVARMDADDRCHPERMARQVRHLAAHPEVSILGCGVRSFRDAGVVRGGYQRYDHWLNELTSHEDILRELFVESPLAHPSVMFRRDAILGVGGYLDRGGPEDYDLWLRAAAAGLRFGKLPEVLLEWRDEPGRTSRTDPRYSTDAFLALKAHHLAGWRLPEGRRLVVWGAGKVGRRLARLLGEAGREVDAFIDIDPRKLGRTGPVPVLAPERLQDYRDAFVVAAVGNLGARDLIRRALETAGFREARDFLCAA